MARIQASAMDKSPAFTVEVQLATMTTSKAASEIQARSMRRDLPHSCVWSGSYPAAPAVASGWGRSVRACRSLEKERRKLGEIAPPDGPGMVAGGEAPLVADVLVLQGGYEFFVASLKKIVLPARNPEQLE